MHNYKKKAVLFLLSQGITLFGSSVVQFAITWYVTLKTSSGVWVSLLTVAACLPQFLISFFSGVWADRYPKRKLIIISDIGIAIATLGLVLLIPFIQGETPLLIALIVISVIRSLGAGIQTPAVNASIPLLVPEEGLMKFNGVNSTIQSLVQFAAPALTGVVLSFCSFQTSLLIDIITAIMGVGILCAVAIPFNKPDSTPSMFNEMKAGFQYAVKDSFIGKILLLFGGFIFLCVPAGFMCSLFVERSYGSAYWYLTVVEIVGFLGMTGGGLLISTWGGFKNRVLTLVVGLLSFGILAIGMGAIDHFIVYVILMGIYGIAITMIQTATMTLLQEHAAPEMQGRVFGLFGAMYSGFLPLGMIVFGPLADIISLRILMITSGVLLIGMAGLIAVRIKK